MSKSGKWKEPLTCPSCKKEIQNDGSHKMGRIKRGDPVGNGGELGENIVKKYYKSTFKEHPFYMSGGKGNDKDRNGIEAHHLVTSFSLKQDYEYQRLAFFLGYNINYWKNGVLLPSIMSVACHYGVPLHKGGHRATFIKTESGQGSLTSKMFKSLDEWNENIQEKEGRIIFPEYDKANELTTINYEDLINKKVSRYCKFNLKRNKFCEYKKEEIEEKATNFINALDKLSQAIFRELISFAWTLTSDGFDYAPGGIGCCGKYKLGDKRALMQQELGVTEKLGAKAFMEAIYKKTIDISQLKTKCIAGNKKHKVTNNSSAYFLERKNIPPFKFE
ncbi:AHH domain-containing protein [Apibacter sp. HY039]|uniref:AHH domain-containing protein n=1 Tax=Apibacter sp. HY039 TaxID=2501476 RepID=UPI000FEBF3D1|nr:AHH domain-containing protein [Apibacter sp. HY039]